MSELHLSLIEIAYSNTNRYARLHLTVILPLMSDLMIENTFDPKQSGKETRHLRAGPIKYE